MTESIVLSGARAALLETHPWVITVDFQNGERRDRVIKVEQVRVGDQPDPWDVLPIGAEALRSDVFPADRFADMRGDVRERYRAQYRAFLVWRKAWALEKPAHALVIGVDYEPARIDESVERWVAAGAVPRDIS